MDTKKTLSRIQQLSNLYIDRSIESCDSMNSVMYELKARVRNLLETPPSSECIHNIANDLSPQLESLAAHLDPSLRDKTSFNHYLIVGGVGRSGTTAFGNALNRFLGSKYKFFMFTERYVWKLPYSPASFLKEFVFREDSRNSKKSIQDKFGRYVEGSKAYESIEFIGDKRPGAAYMLEVDDIFFSYYKKKLLYLHLYRDPISTALSWEKRAVDTKDQWPRSWGAEMMAKHFISQGKIALECDMYSRLRSTQIKFVDYDRFFFDETYCAKLFDYIKDTLGMTGLKSFCGSKQVVEFVNHNRDFVKRRSRNTSESPAVMSRKLENSCNFYHKLLKYDA